MKTKLLKRKEALVRRQADFDRWTELAERSDTSLGNRPKYLRKMTIAKTDIRNLRMRLP